MVPKLANGRLAEPVKLLLSLLQRIAMADGEDDNGISPILAIQLVGASRLQKAVRLAQ